jgi:Zn-dependent protease with chaperone function
MTLPAGAYKLDGISPRAIQHPADRAATAALQQVPYLDAVIRKLIELGYERAVRQALLGSAVRLGDRQLPHIWALEREAFNVLDIPEVPDLYLSQYPIANAAVFGAGQPVVLLNSEIVKLLDEEGLRAVLAHEAAHVLCDHVLYGTALQILLMLMNSVRLPLLAGLPIRAVTAALLEWFRAAELTCDRAAAIVTRDPLAVNRLLMTMSAGAAASDLDLDAFMSQGLEYTEGGRGLERLSRLLLDLRLTHPMPVRRAHELLKWVREGEYDRIIGGEYVRRGEEPPPREEADAASKHYADRVKGAFKDAGESVADVGKQLSDWLDRTKDKTAGEEK